MANTEFTSIVRDHSRMNITPAQRIELARLAACELDQLIAAVRGQTDEGDAVALALLDRAAGIVDALVDIGQPDHDDQHVPNDVAKRIRFSKEVFDSAASAS